MRNCLPTFLQLERYNISPEDVVRVFLRCAPADIQSKVVITPIWGAPIFQPHMETLTTVSDRLVWHLQYGGTPVNVIRSGVGAPQTGDIVPTLKVAAVQMAPVYLDARSTWDKLEGRIREAAANGAELITWSESLIPGYPNWTTISTGDDQKQVYARYWREALRLDGLIVTEMRKLAIALGVMFMGGIAEQQSGSTYCTLLTIGPDGEIWGRHRKLKPTWRERLVWADGDGKGLITHPTKVGRVGGLSCWENWVPLARAALHQQEEMLHVATWPGKLDLTKDITRFMAIEERSWVVSVSGMLRASDWAHLSHDEFPLKEAMSQKEVWQDGGSMIVRPTGDVVAGPFVGEEGFLYADVNPQVVVEERQVLDCSGHYSRNDVLRLEIRRDHD